MLIVAEVILPKMSTAVLSVKLLKALAGAQVYEIQFDLEALTSDTGQ